MRTEPTHFNLPQFDAAQLAEENPNPIVRVCASGQIRYLNPPARRFLRVLGWRHGETLPKQFMEAFRDASTSRGKRELEIATEDHAYRFVFVPQQQGYVDLFGSDIVRCKKAEDDFRRTEERLHALVQAVPAITFEGDSHGNNTFASDGWYQFTGMTPAETKGNGWARALHPDDAERVKEQWIRCLGTGAIFESRHRFCRKDGSCKWFIAKVLPTRDESGRAIRWTGSLTDVDDLSRAEISLRKSMEEARRRAEELSKLMDLVPAAIWVANDPACNVITGNRTANELLEAMSGENVSPRDAAMQARHFFREGQPVADSQLPMQRAVATGQEQRDIELDILLPSGRRVTVLGGASPLRDHAGEVRGSVAAFLDITDRKRTERELSEYRNMLEGKVKKRNAQLKKSQENVKELSRKSIEALEADRKAASRDLHDSIGGSLSALKFILEETVEIIDEPVVAIERLRKALSLIAEVVKETRRISANLRPLSLDDLGLLTTIRGYVNQFNIQYGIQGKCEIDVSEDDVPETLKIVIFRLMQEALSNTAKHSQASHVYVRLAKRLQTIILKVEDDGNGFDPQNLGMKDPLSGYGLKGMRERTEICSGQFSVNSKLGKGTKITAKFDLTPDQPCRL